MTSDVGEPPTSSSAGKQSGDLLADFLNGISRGQSRDVNTYFHQVGDPSLLDGTKTTCHTHWLRSDPNGRPRLDVLVGRLANHVLEYCIPRARIAEATDELNATKSPYKLMQLQDEARSLFSSIENSGEGGELLLYFLLEWGLGIPQILCKMPHKTNSSLMINGVDGVHAKALENGNIAVYWGESKVYDDFASAVSNCFASIEPYLNDSGGGPLARDLLLARDNLDTGEREMTLQMAKYFTRDEPESARLEVRGACLVAFTQSPFEAPVEADEAIKAAVIGQVDKWKKSISKKVVNKHIESFHIEFFCLPIPSGSGFRDSFAKAMGLK